MAASTNERVRRRREAMRSAGLRPVQIWVPDTRRPEFAEQARRQSLLLRDDPEEHAALEWIDEVAEDQDWQ